MQEEVKDIIVIFVHLSIKWCVDCAGKYNGPMLGRVQGGGGASLKTCKSCMLVKYCDANCQKSHWPKHKAECKIRAAKLRNEAPFKDSPSKEECPIPICFLLPIELISCVSLPLATISFISIFDFAEEPEANEGLAKKALELYYTCCGKSICKGCVYSFCESGSNGKCPF